MEIDTMANKTNKLTKMDKFEMLANLPAVQSDPVLSEFVAHEMELLSKKNSSEKKPTVQQMANKGIQTAVLEAMEDGKQYTITELLKITPNLPEDMTNQRMSALVRQMIGVSVERIEDKRKAYFRKIAE